MVSKKRKKERIEELRKIVDAPHLVGDCEDLLPYAWRTSPIIDGRRCSKVLRDMAIEEELRNRPNSK